MLKKTLKKTAALLFAASVMGTGLAVPSYAATYFNTGTTSSSNALVFTNMNDYYNWLQQYFKNYSLTPSTQIPVQKSVPSYTQIPVQKPVTTPTSVSSQPSKANTATQAKATNVTVSSEVQQVVNLVNQERSKAGLAPLKISQSLDQMAQIKAEDMRDHQYFNHTSPTYGSPFDMMKRFGISYSYAGENIAAGQPNAASVVNDWMNSPGHRANILNRNYTEIGVGVAHGGSYGTYWVQEFIRP